MGGVPSVTRLIVGLGNPGPDYEGTRHNVGFRVLDRLALHEGLLFRTASKLASAGEGESYSGPKAFSFARSFDPDAYLVKPETFMNASGDVVEPLARWANVPPERILVVYDDLDLEVAKLRLRPHGGAGGQRGMRSIIDKLGSDRFPRLRVGIGRPSADAARYVLARFPEDDEVEIDIAAAEAVDAILDWLQSGDIERTMSRFHSRWNPPG